MDSQEIEAEVIWLTGCASGIGQHLLKAFVARKYRVIATAMNVDALKQYALDQQFSSDTVLLAKLDINSLDDWQSVYEETMTRWGRVDRLFNIAAYLKPGYIHETDSEEISRHIDTNVKGLMLGSQFIAKKMFAQGYGHIINIASLAGIAPIAGIGLYSASKFAVRGFTLALAQELRAFGIKVTVICPDAVETPMLTLQEDYEEAALTFSGSRALTVQDIEEAVFSRVLTKEPLEIMLPAHRGLMAKLGSAFPELIFLLGAILRRKGKKAQQKRRQTRSG
jgi:3-oxoacyl-[acyl-carrier protein] reductase